MEVKMGKLKRSRKSYVAPDAIGQPWPLLVLAVDPGKLAGWSVWLHGQYCDSGQVRSSNLAKIDEIVGVALAIEADTGVTAVLVLEAHNWGGRGAAATGLGASRQTWIDAWRRAGGPQRRVVGAPVPTWRSKLFGRLRGTVPREAARARAIAGRECGPDESAAVCIGEWATWSGRLAKLVPKRATYLHWPAAPE